MDHVGGGSSSCAGNVTTGLDAGGASFREARYKQYQCDRSKCGTLSSRACSASLPEDAGTTEDSIQACIHRWTLPVCGRRWDHVAVVGAGRAIGMC